MKKILMLLSVFLISVLALSSCVGQTQGPIDGGGGNDDGGGTTDPGGDSDLITYSVSLYRNGQLWIPNMEIYAIFVNDNSVSEALIDDFYGVATFKGDGDYNVHLSDVPEGYTYDPNSNVVDPQHTELIIDLYPILSYDSGDGSGPYNPNAYDISRVGYYKVDIDSINDTKYFHFLPTQSGEYSVESICDIYADEVDPIGIKYTGTEQYINEELGSEVYEDGGVSVESGFTTNFKFSITFDVTELNVARVFAIRAESKIESYPATIYFKIQYVDDYSKGPAFNPTVMEPKEASEDVRIRETGTFYRLIDLNGGKLDVRGYRYNENDGFWHVYDENKYASTNGYGPTLVCPVTTTVTIPGLGTSFGKALGQVPTFLCLVGEDDERLCYDYFLYGSGPLFAEDGSNLEYHGEYYAKYTTNGYVYVTNELMEFYQLLANNKEYFKDGNGWVETQQNASGEYISAGQEDQWLFACGYYE